MKDLEYPAGATPLNSEELEGLKLPQPTSREQLDRWEQANILEAEAWAFAGKHKELLSGAFLLKVHERMFQNVWKWAGKFRTGDKKLGSPHWDIAAKLGALCADVKTWIESQAYSEDEIAARFHHRLVYIHPFVDGNGRHARLATDLLLVQSFGKPRFTWGSGDLMKAKDARVKYLEALRAADGKYFTQLFKFVRS